MRKMSGKAMLVLLLMLLTNNLIQAQEDLIYLNSGTVFKCITNEKNKGVYIGGKLCFKESAVDSNLTIHPSPNLKYGILATKSAQDWVLVDFENQSFRSLFEFISVSELDEFPRPRWITSADKEQDVWVMFEQFNAQKRIVGFQFIQLKNTQNFQLSVNSLLPDSMTYSFAGIENVGGDRSEVTLVCEHANSDLDESIKWAFVNVDMSARNATVKFEKKSFERPFDILKYTTAAHLLCRMSIENLTILPGNLGSTWYFDQITSIESKNEKVLEAVDENDRSAGRIEVDHPEWIVMVDFVKRDAKGVLTPEKTSIKFVMGMEMGFYWSKNDEEIKTEMLTR